MYTTAGQALSAHRLRGLVDTATAAGELVHQLQHERVAAAALLAGAPDLERLARAATFDCALAFAKTQGAVTAVLARLEPKMPDGGLIWIAWPKKTSGVSTDLDEDAVRRIGLAAKLVDVKVCAIDTTWSGLKFVRRLRDRGA